MLNKNYTERISANDVLNHEWIANSSKFNLQNEQIGM